MIQGHYILKTAAQENHPNTMLIESNLVRVRGPMSLFRNAGIPEHQANFMVSSLKKYGILRRESVETMRTPGAHEWWIFTIVDNAPKLLQETLNLKSSHGKDKRLAHNSVIITTDILSLPSDALKKIEAYRKMSRDIGGVVRKIINRLWEDDAEWHRAFSERVECVKEQFGDLFTDEETGELDQLLRHERHPGALLKPIADGDANPEARPDTVKTAGRTQSHEDPRKDAKAFLETYRAKS